MAQYEGEITSTSFLNSDWGADEARWSGALVQEGIKKSLNSKGGFIAMQGKFVCLFKDESDYNSWVAEGSKFSDKNYLISYSKIKYEDLVSAATINVKGNFAGRDISGLSAEQTVTTTASNSVLKNLSFNITYLDDDNNVVALDPSVAITWIVKYNGQAVAEGITTNGSIINDIDLSSVIAAQARNVNIVVLFSSAATGDINTSAKAFNILLNDYSIEFANDEFWTTPWIVSLAATIPLWLRGSVGGNNVELHIDFTDGSRTRQFVYRDYSTSNNSSIPVRIPNTDLNTVGSGVYTVSAYFVYNNTKSPTVYKKVMIKSSVDDANNYICGNLVSSTFTNFTSVPICRFIVSGSIKKVLAKVGEVENVIDITSYSDTYTFSALLNIESDKNTILDRVQLYDYENTAAPYFNEAVEIDNKNRFNATSGAVITIDAAGQTADSNIINSSDYNTPIIANWSGMNWSDNDGWITETINGISVNALAILKESSVRIEEDFTCNGREDYSFEILYKISNSTDDNDVLVSTAKVNGNLYCGLQITPTLIDYRPVMSIYSDDTVLAVAPDELIHLTIVYNNNFNGWGSLLTTQSNFPLTKIYINGKIAREIYNKDGIAQSTQALTLGSLNSNSDLSVYKIRKYNLALSDKQVLSNYLNCYNTNLEDRININTRNNSIYENGISFNKVKGNFNCFVLSSPTHNGELPNYFKPNEVCNSVLPGYVNDVEVNDASIEIYWDKKNYPGNDDLVINITGKDGCLTYLGSSSKHYYRWNWRSKFAKACNITYLDKFDEEGNNITTENSSFIMYPDPKHLESGIECSVLTAKKNAASSMQSHKLGSVNSYNAVYEQLATNADSAKDGVALQYSKLLSDAMKSNSVTNLKNKRISIWQAPFFGFVKIGEGDAAKYEFVGLYTIGPDKGDKKVSGFNNKTYKTMTEIEGANLVPRFTNFLLPWDEDALVPVPDSKGKLGSWRSDLDSTNSSTEAWEVTTTYLKGVSTSTNEAGETVVNDFNEKSEADFRKQLQTEFRDTYKFVFEHGINLVGVEGTPDTSRITTEITNLVWFTEDPNHFVYYYNSRDKEWLIATHIWYDDPEKTTEAHSKQVTLEDGTGGVSIDTTGLSVGEATQAWINARAEHFRDNMATYFNVLDTLIWSINVELHAGTDEAAKNIYPYKLGIEEDNTWRWRTDDTDTRFDIDNEGRATKKYYIELGDSGESGMWGADSTFCRLLNHLAFYNLRKDVFEKTMDAMAALGGGSKSVDGILKFYLKYYWDTTADYFTEMGYNEDAIFTYDQAQCYKAAGGALATNVEPIVQSFGDHKLAERKFMKDRLNYLASKYVYTSILKNDSLALGRNFLGDLKITYDGWVYPASAIGTDSDAMSSEMVRLPKGTLYSFSVNGTGNADSSIGSKSLICDVGDNWSENHNNSDIAVSFDNMPKLKKLDVSGFDGSFVIANNVNLQEIDITNCPKVLAIDIKGSTHLKSLKATNTPLTSIKPASGAPINVLALPESLDELYLDKLSNLQSGGLTFSGWDKVSKIFIRNGHSTLSPLNRIFDAINKGHVYSNIYLTGLNETWNDTVAPGNLESLINFSKLDIKGYTYNNASRVYEADDKVKATLSGTININCHYFVNDLQIVSKDLNINTSGRYYGLVEFNNKFFLEQIHNYLKANNYAGIGSGLDNMANINTRYKNYVIYNKLTDSKHILDKIATEKVSDSAVITNNTDTSSGLGAAPDFMDWGTWFPNLQPLFLFNSPCTLKKLSLTYNKLQSAVISTLNLGCISAGNEVASTYNFDELIVNAPGLTATIDKSYNWTLDLGWTEVVVPVKDFTINANKAILRGNTNSSRVDWQFDNLYINTNEPTTVDGGGSDFLSTEHIKNIYVNQALYWDYLANTNLKTRLVNYDSNYIPYDFLNGKIGSIPAPDQFDYLDYMLLSKAYFKYGGTTHNDYHVFGTNLVLKLKFAYINEGVIMGNAGFYVEIKNKKLVVHYFDTVSNSTKTWTSSTTIQAKTPYTLVADASTEDITFTILNNSELTLEEAKVNVTTESYATPYAFGTYNSYELANSSGDSSEYVDRWTCASSNFVGAIFFVDVSSWDGTNYLTITPSYSQLSGSSFAAPVAINPLSKSYYYKTF